MLDFRIETFLCVCKYMNYTKASDELGLTQPAVSQHIKYLEDFYNTKLFNYQNKKLTLTNQGQFLKHTMETFSHDSLRIKDDIHRIDTLEIINVGATMSIGEFYLPPRLSSFMTKHPELNFRLRIADTKALLEALDAGDLDFILCEGYFDKELYSYSQIKTERILALCSVDYKLPNKITDISSLFSERILLREEGSGTRALFENKLKETGHNIDAFKKRCSINSPDIILQLLLAQQGISFLYESVAKDYISSGLIREIKIPGFSIEHEFNAILKQGSLFQDKYKGFISELI